MWDEVTLCRHRGIATAIILSGPAGRDSSRRFGLLGEITRERHVAARPIQNIQHLAIRLLREAAAERKLPIQKLKQFARTGNQAAVLEKESAQSKLKAKARARCVVGVAKIAVEACKDSLLDAHVIPGELIHDLRSIFAQLRVLRDGIRKDGPNIACNDTEGDDAEAIREDDVRCIYSLSRLLDYFYADFGSLQLNANHDNRCDKTNEPDTEQSREPGH